jgi:hypothetical protein
MNWQLGVLAPVLCKSLITDCVIEAQNLLGYTAVFLTECRPTFQLRTR